MRFFVKGGAAPRPAASPRGIWTKKKAIGLALLMAVVPGWAAALTECRFDVECFETDTCGESSFALEVSGDAAVFSTEYDEMSVLHYDVTDQKTGVFYAAGAGASYLLSVYDGGAARLSVQMTGDPVALSYHGTCEGVE